jgi:hypothetical protein
VHFKCECNRKFGNAPALVVHMKTIHELELKAVPRADFGRDDPQINIMVSFFLPSGNTNDVHVYPGKNPIQTSPTTINVIRPRVPCLQQAVLIS